MISMIRLVSVVALAIAVALPASAQEAVKPASPPTVAVPVESTQAMITAVSKPEIKVTATKTDLTDPDTIVCKRESDTGSRIKSTKICASRRQWAEMGREISKQIRDSVSTASPN